MVNGIRKIALTLPHLPLSGVGTSIGLIEKGLTDAGYNVDVIVTGHTVGGDLKYAIESGWKIIVPGEGIRFLPHRLLRIIEMLHSNRYLMIVNNTSLEMQLLLPCLQAQILRVAVMRALNPNALKYLAINSNYLHAVIGISAEMIRVMKEDANISAPARLIPNCTSVKGGEPPVLNVPLRICYIGRLSIPDKNVRILSRIAQSLKTNGIQFSIEIVGDGKAREELERDFKKRAPGAAIFEGLLPREQTHQIMSQSNFVLLPSINEGLSNVMLEGMALGCVPICSDIENFKWVLGDAFDKLKCRLHNPEDYAQQIAYLSSHPAVYQGTQHYLRERQQSLFTPERTVQGYLDLIRELESGNGRKLPPPCDFKDLKIPREYRLYCTSAWRLLQKTKDLFVRTS